MLSAEEMEKLLLQHLKDQDLLPAPENQVWTVKISALGGRGLFASRDINQGEVIFIDRPLVIGPRCYNKYLPMCINCYKSGCPLFPCDSGCGLPVCSDVCENSQKHVKSECDRLKSWQPTSTTMWSMNLLQAVVPIRALGLSPSQKALVNALQCHEGPRHGREIELLKNNVKNEISSDDHDFMLRVCRVFDTNAFETAVVVDDTTSISLRGLYPLGALQNHNCVPNTRHYFTQEGLMYTRASVPIAKGQELTMTYTDILWDTYLRRKYLMMSKHFTCNCTRCSDPSELGGHLGDLRCANLSCFGYMLPDDPLSLKTAWKCQKCGRKVSARQVEAVRSGIIAIVNEVLADPPRKLVNFIEDELATLVPPTNYFMVDAKFRLVSYFGRIENLQWQDLTNDELQLKAKCCADLIAILDKMGFGECQKKGLLLYELYCTQREQSSREIFNDNLTSENLCSTLQKAVDILQDDIAAPRDLKTTINATMTHTST